MLIPSLRTVPSTLTSSFRSFQSDGPDQLFSYPRPTSIFGSEAYDLSWYNLWLFKELIDAPHEIQQLRVGTDLLRQSNAFERVFAAVARFVRAGAVASSVISIDGIVEHLRETLHMDATYESGRAQRSLVFAILGWQSMLYRAAFNHCSLDELAIHEADEPSLPSAIGRAAFTTNKVSAASVAGQPLSALLKGFGSLLPQASPVLGSQLPSDYARIAAGGVTAGAAAAATAIWLPLNPAETNMYFLRSILQVKVRWVDTLAQHLDYDRSSRTLSLFSYPSFCAAMLQSKGTLHAFATTAAAAAAAAAPPPENTRERMSFDYSQNSFNSRVHRRRSAEEDIAQLLREVLLSFRLLFGQHARSRRSFPHVYRLTDRAQVPDQLLASLCMTKHMPHHHHHQNHRHYHHRPFGSGSGFGSGLNPGQHHSLHTLPIVPDQPVYFAAQHFPTFAARIEVIARELKDCRPSSLAGLLRDRRDTLQYWTFWLVAIIGGVGIFLSFVQVILQTVQLVLG